jgi:hypothetical protein
LPGDTLTSRVTLKDMRRGNRCAVLRLLLLDGPLNRIALGARDAIVVLLGTGVGSAIFSRGHLFSWSPAEASRGRPTAHSRARDSERPSQ